LFLISSMIYSRLGTGEAHPFSTSHVLVYFMLALTAVSQFKLFPKMDALRTSMGEIDKVPLADPARILFDSLHVWSTRLEVGVFVLGLILVYLVAQQVRS